MNTITIEMEVDDPTLLNTLYQTIAVEMQATKTDRGEAQVTSSDNRLFLTITAVDYVAARAITNSIMRLLQASVDVAEAVIIRNTES